MSVERLTLQFYELGRCDMTQIGPSVIHGGRIVVAWLGSQIYQQTSSSLQRLESSKFIKMHWRDATHQGAWKATITWAVLSRAARNVVEFNSTTPSNCGRETFQVTPTQARL